MRSKILLVMSTSLLVMVLTGQNAMAQKTVEVDPKSGDQIQTKTADEVKALEFERKAIRMGPWRIYPDIASEVQFNDNIYYSDNIKESDVITVVEPALRISNSNENQSVSLFVKSRNGIYADNTDENYTNNLFNLSGQQVISRGVRLNGKLRYFRGAEPRNSEANVVATTEPIRYGQYLGVLDLTYQKGLYGFTTGVEFERNKFSNVEGRSIPVSVNNDRNRDVWRGKFGVQYDIKRDYTAFVQTEINRVEYQRRDYIQASSDYVGPKRDSEGYKVLAGARFNPTPLIRADLGIGYLEQNYDDPALEGVNGIAIEASADWNISPITTVSFGLSRTVQETVTQGSAGFIATQADVRLAHKFRRNMELSVFTEMESNSYEQVSRDDDITGFGMALDYKLNRSLGMIFEYRYDRRDSSIQALDYTRSLFTVRLKYQF